MVSKTRTEADLLIDQMSRLPNKKQPRWFREMFKDWVPDVSTSMDYSTPDGLPDFEDEDAGLPPVSANICDTSVFEDEFEEECDDEFDDQESVEQLEEN